VEDSKRYKAFKRRFRVTPPQFHELVSLVRDEKWWDVKPVSASGKPSSPLELLVLGRRRSLVI